MKAGKILETKVKELIVPFDGCRKLINPVPVILKTYIGYNYDKKEHKYIDSVFNIVEIMRYGKKGVVYVSDGINMWRPSELSESDCEKIINEL